MRSSGAQGTEQTAASGSVSRGKMEVPSPFRTVSSSHYVQVPMEPFTPTLGSLASSKVGG